MIVKTLKRAAAVAAILSAATVANASTFNMKKFHVGVDAMGTTLDWTATGGQNIFPKNPMNFGAFVGADFYSDSHVGLGLELGAEYMQRTRNVTLAAGQMTNTGVAVVGANQAYNTKLQVTTPYLGLTGNYVINQHFKLIGMVGAGASMAKITENVQTVGVNSTQVLKKTAFVPMVRLGVQYDLNEHFAVRANVGYRYTGKIKATQASVTSGSTAVYSMQAKNSTFVYGAGVVFSF